MKDDKNYEWTMKDVAHQYKLENPEWSWKKCWSKADIIYKELKRLNNGTWNNNSTFFKMNTPFSFYDDRDSEFGEKFVDYDND